MTFLHEICIPSCEIEHQNIAWSHLTDMTDEELDSDLKLEEFFGSLYVINLPHAKERLSRVTAALHDVGVRHFQVWRATNGRDPLEVSEAIWRKMNCNWRKLDPSTPEGLKALEHQYQGEAGCFMSHYRLLQHVREKFHEACQEWQAAASSKDKAKAIRKARKYSSVLVMEDDNGYGFVNSDGITASLQGVGRHIREALTELPQDWDMLYFMVQSGRYAHRETPHLKRLAWGTIMNAYAISYRMYDSVIEHLKRIEDPSVQEMTPVDNEIAMLHGSHRCYAIFPSIAYQCEGTSQIVGWTTVYLRQLQP